MLRASPSIVVTLSSSQRNAASESEEKAVARGSWLVKIHHYTRIGYDGISQRAALRDAQRASHLPSRQAVDEGIADGGGDGAAPFSAFGDDVGNAGFHDDFFGIDDVDETDRDADD